MADARTEITELATALGTLGDDSVEAALARKPGQMVSLSPEKWTWLDSMCAGGRFESEFERAFDNGRAFLQAPDGLRNRLPLSVEWKGSHKNTGDSALPIDLRIDHVFLISCKYNSRILHNSSPVKLFDQLLAGSAEDRKVNWFADVAPVEYFALWDATRTWCGNDQLPASPLGLTKSEQKLVQELLPLKWPEELAPLYVALCQKASSESAQRWNQAMPTKAQREKMLWRLLRMGPSPYFVLGSAGTEPVRTRVATPWDWRQAYEFVDLSVEPMAGGQPKVAWTATVTSLHTGLSQTVGGFVEVRWSHGKFSGYAEAKVHMNTPHEAVPGYFPLQ